MKKLITAVFLIGFFAVGHLQAVKPSYCLNVKNITYLADTAVEFDIYLLHTNPDSINYEYALGQYYFDFNEAILNGGIGTYKIISSDFLPVARPRNPHITGSVMYLNSNVALGMGNGPAISSTGDGTLIVKMRLTTSAGALDTAKHINLVWRNHSSGNPFTKLFSYLPVTMNTEITNSDGHIINGDCSNIPPPPDGEIPPIDTTGTTAVEVINTQALSINWASVLEYYIPANGQVALVVYDVTGKQVASYVNNNQQQGKYTFNFDANNLSNGIYFYRVSLITPTNNYVLTKKKMIAE